MSRKASDVLRVARSHYAGSRRDAVASIYIAMGEEPFSSPIPMWKDRPQPWPILDWVDGMAGIAYGSDFVERWLQVFDVALSLALSDESAPAPAPEGGK